MELNISLKQNKKTIIDYSTGYGHFDFWAAECLKSILQQLGFEWRQRNDKWHMNSGYPRSFSWQDPIDKKLAVWLAKFSLMCDTGEDIKGVSIELSNNKWETPIVINNISWKDVWNWKILSYIQKNYHLNFIPLIGYSEIEEELDWNNWVKEIIEKHYYISCC